MVTTTVKDDNKIEDKCSSGSTLPQEIKDILEFLSENQKIVFKSQQRCDPELLPADKIKMAQEVYERNPQTFLLRFGSYLQEQHLEDFARHSIADSDEEMHDLVEQYQAKLKSRRLDIKNRRYAALQKLIKEGDYFSEQEMMRRAPELYQELVGQYLSSAEKKQRDSYDVRNTSFSGILIHTMEQQEITNLMAKAEQQINMEKNQQKSLKCGMAINENDKEMDCKARDKEEEEEVPVNFRKQWGNFDNENIACSSYATKTERVSYKKHPPDLNNLISAGERDLLKQEFIGIMHEQFLAGQDVDFDYSSVDDNTQFDDLQQIDRDKEDEYFNDSDDEEEHSINDQLVVPLHCENSDESEDELDIYMNHLQKHHSLQQR